MMSKETSTTIRPWSIGLTLALSLGLLFAYAYLIAPQYAYLGYRWVAPDLGFLGLCLVGLCAMAVILPQRIEAPSDFMVWVLFASVIVPVVVVSNVIGLLTFVQLVSLVFWLACAFLAAVVIARWGQGVRWPSIPRLPRHLYLAGLGLFILVTLAILVKYNGLRLSITGILGVYEVRSEYKEALSSFPLLAYLVPTLGYVGIPLLLIWAIHKRSWVWGGVAIAAQVFLYAQTGYKTFLFGIPLIVLLGFFVGRRPLGFVIPASLSLGVIGAAMADLVTNGIIFSSLFTRRFLATPGQLAANYIEFFSEHRFVLLSNSVFSQWVSYPYDVPVPFLMGRWIHGVETNSSNVNLFGDGFAQAGWLGMLIAGIALGGVLVVIDWAASQLPLSVPMMLMFLPCIVLGNASILTAMLSHGLAASVAALALAPRDLFGAHEIAAKKSLAS